MRSERIKWQVQARAGRNAKWKSKGTYETRTVARERAAAMRTNHHDSAGKPVDGYGARNTRVIPKITGGL